MNIYCFPFKADFYARKLLYLDFKVPKELTNSIIKCFLFRYQKKGGDFDKMLN